MKNVKISDNGSSLTYKDESGNQTLAELSADEGWTVTLQTDSEANGEDQQTHADGQEKTLDLDFSVMLKKNTQR